MNELSNQVNQELYVALIAIDWANEEHQLCLLKRGTNKREYEVLEQKPERIQSWVLQLKERFGVGKVAIAIEQSKGPLIYALMHYDFIDIYPINPSTLGSYRLAFRPSGAKNDIIDVNYLMDILQGHRDKLRLWKADTEQTRILDIYCRERRNCVNTRVEICNRYKALLKEYYPQAIEMIGNDLGSQMAIDFLMSWPCFQKLAKARKETLVAFYHQHGSRSETLIQKRLTFIENTKPLTSDNAIIKTSQQILNQELKLLKTLQQSIAFYDAEIKQCFNEHQDAYLFKALPGAGEALAPRLLVAFGTDRARFDSALEIQAFSGIAPIVKESATEKLKEHDTSRKTKPKGTKITLRRRRCPKFLLQTFHEFAKCSIGQSLWARAYYEQQRNKGQGKNAAIRSLAYKWIRIIYACWKNKQIYDEQTYIHSLKKRSSTLVPLIDSSSRLVA